MMPETTDFTPRVVFRLVIASVGLWYLFEGARYLLSAALWIARLIEPQDGNSIQAYAVTGMVEVVVGFLAMCGLLPLESLAFPPHRDAPDADSDETRTMEEDEPTA